MYDELILFIINILCKLKFVKTIKLFEIALFYNILNLIFAIFLLKNFK